MLRVAQTGRAPGRGPGGRRFKSAHAPHMHRWRNRKTRQTQTLVSARTCGFKSHPVYHVGRNRLHSVSAVSVRAAKTAYPPRPSSFSKSNPLRWVSIWIAGSIPASCTIYVACSSDGQSAGSWPRRSAVQIRSRTPYAQVAEPEDAPDSDSGVREDVWVQIPPCVPRRKKSAPFRFRGFRKSRENCISADPFLLSKPEPLRRVPVLSGMRSDTVSTFTPEK